MITASQGNFKRACAGSSVVPRPAPRTRRTISREIHEFATEQPPACRNGPILATIGTRPGPNQVSDSSPPSPPEPSLLGPGIFLGATAPATSPILCPSDLGGQGRAERPGSAPDWTFCSRPTTRACECFRGLPWRRARRPPRVASWVRASPSWISLRAASYGGGLSGQWAEMARCQTSVGAPNHGVGCSCPSLLVSRYWAEYGMFRLMLTQIAIACGHARTHQDGLSGPRVACSEALVACALHVSERGGCVRACERQGYGLPKLQRPLSAVLLRRPGLQAGCRLCGDCRRWPGRCATAD